MKNIRLFTLLAIFIIMPGCTLNTELVQRGAVSSRNDVFIEVVAGTEIPRGYTLLSIYSSFKTTIDRSLSEMINIDGQALRLADLGKEEDSDASGLRDPEAGRGFRHVFRTSLMLKAGTHSLIAALPNEGIAVTNKITLSDGTRNLLQIEPQYYSLPASCRLSYTETCYKEGLLRFNTKLNGNPL